MTQDELMTQCVEWMDALYPPVDYDPPAAPVLPRAGVLVVVCMNTLEMYGTRPQTICG